jgi:HEPN domain-containing protein
MPVSPNEWLEQADYDMETAEYMFAGGRFFYAVFMIHLDNETVRKILLQGREFLEWIKSQY